LAIIQQDINKGNDNSNSSSRQACEKGLRFITSSAISWGAVGARDDQFGSEAYPRPQSGENCFSGERSVDTLSIEDRRRDW
jgi:hypothetical protein